MTQIKSCTCLVELTTLDCVIIDELGYIPFPKSGGALLFHLINMLLSYDLLWLLWQREPLPATPFMAGSGGGRFKASWAVFSAVL